jgi:gp16 family phage-associated protein
MMSKTAIVAVKKLRDEGKTIPDWAKENGFHVRSVRAVVYGHNKGNWGQAHKIAVALGLKAGSQ